ncbi:hypothetical protein D5086_002451 [Populus alba]|uniref:Uncharacterized protein n=1 Tax=Populus alba TaxID=43335 RepID=A0ACC4D1K6_POPAL
MKGLHGFCGAGGQVLVLDMQRRRQQCKQVFSGGGADEGWAYFFATPSHSSTSTTAMSYRNIMNSNE